MKIDIVDALIVLLMMLVLFCCYSAYEIQKLKQHVLINEDRALENHGWLQHLDTKVEERL